MHGRKSTDCIGSKVAFICGMVCFSTCLTGWVNSFRLSLRSVTLSVVVVVVIIIIVDVAVWVRVIGATVYVSEMILSIFSFFSLFFQKGTLISVMSWFFTVMARWFASVGLSFCGLLAHSGYL